MKVFAITVQQRTDLLNRILKLLEGGPKSVEELEEEIPESLEWRPVGQVRLRAAELMKSGFIYSVPGGYLTLTKHGKEVAGNYQGTETAADTYKAFTEEDMATFTNSFKPYWDYFKSNHPEYIKVYEKFESDASAMKGLIGDVYEILQHNLGSGEAITLFENEADYTVPKNLVSVEHAIFEEMTRVLQHDKKFQTIKTIRPENYIATTRYLKDFFVKNGASLVQNVLIASARHRPGSVLTEADIDNTVGEIPARGIDKGHLKNSIYGWLVKQTNEGEYGVFLQGTNESSMITGLRELFKEEPDKGTAILKNFRTTGPVPVLNKILSNGANFEGVKFDKGNFSDLGFSGSKFLGCNFKGATFTNSTVTNCDFSGSFLNDAVMDVREFSGNKIQDTDFSGVTGLGNDKVIFKDNKGKPRNLKLIKEVVDSHTYNEVSKDINRSYHMTLPVGESEKDVAQELLKGLHKIITGGGFEQKVSGLKFAADNVNLEQLKQQLMEVIDSKGASRPADWMQDASAARQKLIDYNRQGLLKQIGMDSMIGKLIGYLSPKQQKEVGFQDKINDFVNQNLEKTMYSKNELLNAIPPTATNVRSIVENVSKRDTLTQRDLTQIYTALMQTLYSEDSPLLAKIESGIKTFPHAIRISDMARDRTSRDYSSNYPNTFGITIEPYTQGLPANLKKVMDSFLMHGGHPKDPNEQVPGGWQTHWVRAISSARVRPVKFQNYGVEGGESLSVWLIMEVQSDPVQHADEGYNLFKPKGVSTGNMAVDMHQPKQVNLFNIVYSLGPKGERVPLRNVAEEFLKISPALVIGTSSSEKPHDEQVKEAIKSIQGFAKSLMLYELAADSIRIKSPNEAYAAKGLLDFRSYYNTWPEVTMLATIRKALEHGGVDEVWIPTAENMLAEAGGSKATDRTIQYDIPAQRLGGVRFKPPVTVTSDAGSQMWSTQQERNHPKTFYRIDLTPFKMDATVGDTVPSKADPNVTATIQRIDKFSKLEKMIDTKDTSKVSYTYVTPRDHIVSNYLSPLTKKEDVSKAQIVIIYSLSTHKGNELFVAIPKDFTDQFMVEKRFSNLSLRFTSMDTNLLKFDSNSFEGNRIRKQAASPQAESVLKYVESVKHKNSYLEMVPEPLLLASGIAKRQHEEQWTDEVVNSVIAEFQQLGKVVYRPIRRYVSAIVHIINKKLETNLQRIVQNTGEPVEQIGKELIVSYMQRKHGDWGEEETQYLVSEVERIATQVVYPTIQPRDPFAPDVPRREPQEGTHDPVSGDPITPTPAGGGAPETPAPKQPEGPIPGLTFVKPTGEELEGYNKEYETRLYDRLKKALDDEDYEKAKRLHKMLSILVSGETPKKREEYSNRLLDYLNEANAAKNEDKARTIKEMLTTLHITSSLNTIIGDLKFS
jgi:uncharacterized protein YjbI with pentapeptide repeats